MNKSNIIIGTLVASLSLIGSSMVFADEDVAGKGKGPTITKSKKSLFIANEIHVQREGGEKEHYIILKHVHGDRSQKEARDLILKSSAADAAGSSIGAADSNDIKM